MSNSLLREGPIPVFVHGVIEYLAGVFLIAAPILFEFESSAAKSLSVVLGIVILLLAATTSGATGLIDGLSISVHAVLDYVLALVLIAAPFLFNFSDETNPTVMFIAVGVIHLLITVGTRFMSKTAPKSGV